MTFAPQRLTADIAVAGQLDPAAMAEAAAAGFRSVVNNRPDFEGGPTQPTSASIEAAARAAGLAGGRSTSVIMAASRPISMTACNPTRRELN